MKRFLLALCLCAPTLAALPTLNHVPTMLEMIQPGETFLPTTYLGGKIRVVGSGCRYATPALGLAAASSGDFVYVTPGDYAIPTNLSIPSGVHVVGLGAKFTTLTLASGVVVTAAGGNLIQGIWLVGVQGANNALNLTGNDIHVNQLWITGTDHSINAGAGSAITGTIRVTNCKGFDLTTDLVRWNGAANSTGQLIIEDNECQQTIDGGAYIFSLQISSPIANVHIRRNRIYINYTSAALSATQRFIWVSTTPAANAIQCQITSEDNSMWANCASQASVFAWADYAHTDTSSANRKDPIITCTNDKMHVTTGGTINGLIGVANTGSGSDSGRVTFLNCDFPATASYTTTSTKTKPILRGSTLSRTYANADGSTVTVLPNLGDTETWTCTQNTSLVVASGTYFSGQTVELIVTDAGAHTLTPDASTVFGSTIATVAGKRVSVRYRFDGSTWMEVGKQTTGY